MNIMPCIKYSRALKTSLACGSVTFNFQGQNLSCRRMKKKSLPCPENLPPDLKLGKYISLLTRGRVTRPARLQLSSCAVHVGKKAVSRRGEDWGFP